MILFIGLACLAIAVAVFCPDTTLGRALHRALIEQPCRALTREGLTRGAAGALVFIFLLSVLAAPELLAVLAITDLTIYFEVIVLATVLGAGARIEGFVAAVAARVRRTIRVLARARPASTPRTAGRERRIRRKAAPPKSDPDRAWRPALALGRPSLAFAPSFA